MAVKFKPRKNKVTGTKKKDKITWVSSKAWKKALTVNAGAGNDVINFKKSKYKNTLNGQDGNDIIYGGTKTDKINGGKGNDKLYGYNGNDIIKAGAGNDYIDGGSGNDVIYGESGDNILKGGKGDDKIYGGSGNDTIYGVSGKNLLIGGEGKNTIFAGTGTNVIRCGSGYDLVDISKGTNTVIIENIERGKYIKGFSANDMIQINTAYYLDQDPSWELYVDPWAYNSETKTLVIHNFANYQEIHIANYNNETNNGLIKLGDSAAIRMQEFLEDNEMYIYTDEANTLSDVTYGYHYTMGGNDTITSVVGAMLLAGDGNDSITGICGTSGHSVYVYGEDGDDKIETLVDNTYSANLNGGKGNDTIISHMVGATIFGEEGNDVISGGYCMRGGDGNDTITSHEVTTSWHDNSQIYGDAGDDEIHILDGHTISVYYRFESFGDEGNDIIYDNLTGERCISFYNDDRATGTDFLNSVKYYKDGNDLIISYLNTETQEYDNSMKFVGFMNLSETAQNNLKYYYYEPGSSWQKVTVKSLIGTDNYEEITRTPSVVDVPEMTQAVAGWLSSGGSEYGSVNDALADNKNADITTLIAQYDNANLQNLNL